MIRLVVRPEVIYDLHSVITADPGSPFPPVANTGKRWPHYSGTCLGEEEDGAQVEAQKNEYD